MRSRLLLFPAAFALLACPAEQPAVVTDDAEGRRQVEQLRDNWQSAEQRDDAAAVAALYTTNAVLVAPDGSVASGRDAIQQAFSEQFAASSIENISSQWLEVSGTLAVDYGEFTQRIQPPNQPARTVRGHYLVVLQRQADGSWLITRQIAVSPAAAAVQPAGQPGARPGMQPGAQQGTQPPATP